MFLFKLSKEWPDLAAAEVKYLLGLKRMRVLDGCVIAEFSAKKLRLAERLALTKYVYRILFECDECDLFQRFERFDWKAVVEGSFCIKAFKHRLEKELAKFVWIKLKNPRVDLENPDTKIVVLKAGKRCFCCIELLKIKHAFAERRPDKRPGFHPSTLKPKLALALVNLCSAKKRVLDPFCGIGGILIEAGLIGLKVVGYDIDPRMMKKAKLNLDFYGIKNYRLVVGDARKIKRRYRYIVSDLPYGLSTFNIERERLYLDFLINLKRILLKRAVIVFPHFVDYKKLIKRVGLKLKDEFEIYVHKNLRRKICVIEP